MAPTHEEVQRRAQLAIDTLCTNVERVDSFRGLVAYMQENRFKDDERSRQCLSFAAHGIAAGITGGEATKNSTLVSFANFAVQKGFLFTPTLYSNEGDKAAGL